MWKQPSSEYRGVRAAGIRLREEMLPQFQKLAFSSPCCPSTWRAKRSTSCSTHALGADVGAPIGARWRGVGAAVMVWPFS